MCNGVATRDSVACESHAHAGPRPQRDFYVRQSVDMQPWVIVAAPVKLISPTREEREREKKGQSIREGCQAGRLRCQDGNRWKGGVALPVRLFVQRTVRRIAIQTFSAHFFVPPAGELFRIFFPPDGREGCRGLNYSSRATADKSAKTHKLGCSVEKCFAPGNKKNIYIHTCSISARAYSWKDPLVRLANAIHARSRANAVFKECTSKFVDQKYRSCWTGKRHISRYFI